MNSSEAAYEIADTPVNTAQMRAASLLLFVYRDSFTIDAARNAPPMKFGIALNSSIQRLMKNIIPATAISSTV